MLDVGTNESMAPYAGPGGRNDYDMLVVGLDRQSIELVGAGASNVEYRAHFSMWCMVSSPLLIGTDVTALSKYDLETLTNAEVIAINQDPAGVAATVVYEENDGQLQNWARTLNDTSVAVAFVNRGPETVLMSLDVQRYLEVEWKSYIVRDLWAHEEQGPVRNQPSQPRSFLTRQSLQAHPGQEVRSMSHTSSSLGHSDSLRGEARR